MTDKWDVKLQIDRILDELKIRVSKTFASDVSKIEPEYQLGGFAGVTFRLLITFSNGNTKDVIIKRVGDSDKEASFYREVLSDLGIRHAKCIDSYSIGRDNFIIFEYIPSCEVSFIEKDRFEKAIDWLIDKDQKVIANQDVFNYDSVEKDCHNVFDKNFWKKLDKAVDREVHDLIDDNFRQLMKSKSDIFLGLNGVLSETPQTINHNDLQMNNILFPKDDSPIVVIDWTHPNKGSVLVDLIKLINVTPQNLRQEMVNRYLRGVAVENFKEMYKVGEIRSIVGTFGWMLDVLVEGQEDKMNMDDFKMYRKMIIEY